MDIKNSSKITKIFQITLREIIGRDAAIGLYCFSTPNGYTLKKLIFDPLTNELTPGHDKSILELNRDSINNEYLSKDVP
jgi:hypothetical protein